MLKPEQIPDEVFEAFQKAWAVTSTLSTKECLAAAINAWPGMITVDPDSWVRCRRDGSTIIVKRMIAKTIILPLPKEPEHD